MNNVNFETESFADYLLEKETWTIESLFDNRHETNIMLNFTLGFMHFQKYYQNQINSIKESTPNLTKMYKSHLNLIDYRK